MPKVKFHLTPEFAAAQGPRFLYRKGGRREESHKGGVHALLVPPIWMADGDALEMPPFEAQWCLACYPDNFSLVEE